EDAEKDSQIKAILLDINSPGGSAVATDEIANAIKRCNKTTVAVIRETGTSGAYWIASAADYVIANRMSVTGSIGVIGSYFELSGLLERYNITYERLVSGEYKDIGTPFKELTLEERKKLQGIIDEIHEDFINAIAENRNMSKEKIKEIATGEFFTGKKAKELGLVDELGGMDEAEKYIEKKLNITVKIRKYEKPISFSDLLSGLIMQKSIELKINNEGLKV
ncbi:MAG: signal peptide peptidase SppA, partial [Candidatus Woesearchaeota archaeon]|nr:signal peptide peptidase SppA [Candidatus Woesearchaeota archaeon]